MVQPTSHQPVLLGTYKITLDDQAVSYAVKRSYRAKYARLEVSVETGLTIVIPSSYDIADIPDLLRKRGQWILDKLAKYASGCFWQVKRGPPSAVQMGTTPGKNIYLSSHLSFSSSSSL